MRRIIPGLLLLVLALGCAWLGLRTWLAARAVARQDYALAVHYRPDIPRYQLLLGSKLLMTRPPEALKSFHKAIQLNPYSEAARFQYALGYLGSGNYRQAIIAARRGIRAVPNSFELHWLLANLDLAHGDNRDFWHEFPLVSHLARPQYFGALIVRASTAPGGSFLRIWRDLPDNLPATLAFDSTLENTLVQTRQAALQRIPGPAGNAHARLLASQLQDQNSALTLGVNRLLRLARLRTPADTAQIIAVSTQIIVREIHYRPSLALALWNVGSREGLYPGPLKHTRGELVTADQFPAGSLQAVISNASDWLGWFPMGNAYTAEHIVALRQGTALAIQLHGPQGGTLNLLRQWLTIAPFQALNLSITARCRHPGACAGLHLRLFDTRGHKLFSLPVKLSPTWQTSQGIYRNSAVIAAAAGINAARRRISSLTALHLVLYYRRPLGQTPLVNTILIRKISVRAVTDSGSGGVHH